ncbi:MAG TPA: hypothetical protein VM431_09535 [Phycisphaerae bacterium]|nr:hypothetical protein [Phycisphaerae bacterium]
MTDLGAFFKEVDEGYPFFELKGIQKDWAAAKARLATQVRRCRSDSDFLGLVVEAIGVLRDAHMTIQDPKAQMPQPPAEYYPGLSFLPALRNTVVVMYPPRGREAELKTGTLVVAIDGKPARAVLDERAKRAWAKGGSFSSPQRARLFGEKTAGSSSSKRQWTFPSGIASIRISVRSRWRADRKPIEFNGIDPDVPVEAVPPEVAGGLNSAIRRAEAYLRTAPK